MVQTDRGISCKEGIFILRGPGRRRKQARPPRRAAPIAAAGRGQRRSAAIDRRTMWLAQRGGIATNGYFTAGGGDRRIVNWRFTGCGAQRGRRKSSAGRIALARYREQ
jgi:hypothetical protein